MKHISDYVRPIDTHIFKVMKRNLPGPFTFILEANNNVPKLFKQSKKTVGVRIPDNAITCQIVRQLGNPILSTSVKLGDESDDEDITDPSLIEERLSDLVDIVIDGGPGGLTGSTVVDCTSGACEILRQGKGELIE